MDKEIQRTQRIKLLNEALDVRGITCLHILDQNLTNELVEIIGALYRLAKTEYTDNEIEMSVIGRI